MDMNEPRLPIVAKICKVLNDAGVRYAIGGSTLLFIKGISFSFNDLDLMVLVEDAEKAREVLKTIGEYHPSDKKSSSKTFDEFTVDGLDVDVISGFILESYGKQYDCSFKNENTEVFDLLGTPVVLDSLQAWYDIYLYLGRVQRARYIKDYLLYHK